MSVDVEKLIKCCEVALGVDYESFYHDMLDALQELATLRQREAEVRELVEAYKAVKEATENVIDASWHGIGCPAHSDPKVVDCTCGYNASLDALDVAEERLDAALSKLEGR